MKLHIHQPILVINRVGALLIDMFIISLIYGILAAVISGNYKGVLDRFQASLGNAYYDIALAFILMALYFVVLPLFWTGHTVGGRFTRTQLVKENGAQPDVRTLLWRFLLVLVSNVALLGIPAVLNLYMMLLRKDNRGYHDLAARTKVISRA